MDDFNIHNEKEKMEDEKMEKNRKLVSLERYEAIRIDVTDEGSHVNVRVDSGTCEIFGTEMARSITYEFQNTSISIFTWEGCFLTLTGDYHSYKPKMDSKNIEENAPFRYLQLHKELEMDRRKVSEHFSQLGPRVLVIGSSDSGKTSFSRILYSYATRVKRKVAFVDLNCELPTVSIPGSVSCIVSKEPYSLFTGFALSSSVPFTYYFGNSQISDNVEHYQKIIDQLSIILERRCVKDDELRQGGYIIDTSGYTKNKELYVDMIKKFKISHVFMIGGEGRLYHDLKEEVLEKRVSEMPPIKMFEGIQKNDGVVPKEEYQTKMLKRQAIEKYFYGGIGMKRIFKPSNLKLKFSDLQVVRIGGFIYAPSSTLPIGMKSVVDKCQLYDIPITNELTNSILAISNAKEKSEVIKESVCGFVLVKKVDVKAKELYLLAPCPLKIEKKLFIVGKQKWIDQ